MSADAGAAAVGSFALDLDGTLIGCQARQTKLAGHLAIELGEGGLDEQAFWKRKRAGASTRGALEEMGWSPESAGRLAAAWGEQIEANRWLDHDRLLGGALETLSMLGELGLRVVLLTGRMHLTAVQRQLLGLGLAPLIDELIVVRPAAARTEKAAELRRVRPRGFVGDTESDAQAAADAGVPFAAVSTGQRSADFLARVGVRRIYPDVRSAVVALLGP